VIGGVPAARKLLIEGDLRDWDAIETWAEGIARELAAPAVTSADLAPLATTA
jgi:hypothetical protein